MKINSIFKSINGEVSQNMQGRMTTFIRTQGCNLSQYGVKCSYCDTPQAYDPNGGVLMSVEKIVEEVEKLNCNNITITGGEPYYQDDIEILTNALTNLRYNICIETNGLIDCLIGQYDELKYVIDYKLKGSHVSKYRCESVFDLLTADDIVKFVITDKKDFNEAVKVIELLPNTTFAFSPVFGKVDPNELLSWMKEVELNNAVLNVQLHKLLNIWEPY